MESIRGYFKALKWRSLIVAFSAILLGLLFILTPQASADVICYVAGILLLASGVAAVISYLASGRLFGSYALVSGIVLLVRRILPAAAGDHSGAADSAVRCIPRH